jgi:hypothetical protein
MRTSFSSISGAFSTLKMSSMPHRKKKKNSRAGLEIYADPTDDSNGRTAGG